LHELLPEDKHTGYRYLDGSSNPIGARVSA
jgi:hypothetical protein